MSQSHCGTVINSIIPHNPNVLQYIILYYYSPTAPSPILLQFYRLQYSTLSYTSSIITIVLQHTILCLETERRTWVSKDGPCPSNLDTRTVIKVRQYGQFSSIEICLSICCGMKLQVNLSKQMVATAIRGNSGVLYSRRR